MTDQERNEQIQTTIKAQVEARGYAVASNGTPTRHAARTVLKGWGGHLHARAMCQPHTPRVYAGLCVDQSVEVTCKRCLAGLAKRNIKV